MDDRLELVAVARERDRLGEREVEADEGEHDRDQADLDVGEALSLVRPHVSRPPRGQKIALAVLLEEEVGLAEGWHAGRLGDVLHAEGRVVGGLARDQRLAEGVAGLAGLAVGLAVA